MTQNEKTFHQQLSKVQNQLFLDVCMTMFKLKSPFMNSLLFALYYFPKKKIQLLQYLR